MFTFFHKKPKPTKNINLYTTRLPKNGWIFECMECSNRTGNMIIIKEYEVYICRPCLSKIKRDIKKNLLSWRNIILKKINDRLYELFKKHTQIDQ